MKINRCNKKSETKSNHESWMHSSLSKSNALCNIKECFRNQQGKNMRSESKAIQSGWPFAS